MLLETRKYRKVPSRAAKHIPVWHVRTAHTAAEGLLWEMRWYLQIPPITTSSNTTAVGAACCRASAAVGWGLGLQLYCPVDSVRRSTTAVQPQFTTNLLLHAVPQDLKCRRGVRDGRSVPWRWLAMAPAHVPRGKQEASVGMEIYHMYPLVYHMRLSRTRAAGRQRGLGYCRGMYGQGCPVWPEHIDNPTLHWQSSQRSCSLCSLCVLEIGPTFTVPSHRIATLCQSPATFHTPILSRCSALLPKPF